MSHNEIFRREATSTVWVVRPSVRSIWPSLSIFRSYCWREQLIKRLNQVYITYNWNFLSLICIDLWEFYNLINCYTGMTYLQHPAWCPWYEENWTLSKYVFISIYIYICILYICIFIYICIYFFAFDNSMRMTNYILHCIIF